MDFLAQCPPATSPGPKDQAPNGRAVGHWLTTITGQFDHSEPELDVTIAML
jgi:hypothetical protein